VLLFVLNFATGLLIWNVTFGVAGMSPAVGQIAAMGNAIVCVQLVYLD